MARYQPPATSILSAHQVPLYSICWPLGSLIGPGQYNLTMVSQLRSTGMLVSRHRTMRTKCERYGNRLTANAWHSYRHQPNPLYSGHWESRGDTNRSNERRGTGLPAMKRLKFNVGAFSLVEVTLALGVAAFCLLAVFGLVPVGVQTNRNATSQTAATNIIALVVADLRATPKTAPKSQLFCITFGSPRTLYFDSQGQCSSDLAGLIPCSCIAGM